MTIRYVGQGGSDAANGLSWANRKLTLNGVEDTPVVAGDIVYVGPGAYRELLTVDVAGTGGNPIVYIGDVTGENTDGVGGIVRHTGTTNDQSVVRGSAISMANARSYRTFRGFSYDSVSGNVILVNDSSSNLTVEDCTFEGGTSTGAMIGINGTGTGHIIRRCWFNACAYHIQFIHSATVSDANHLVENCIFMNNAQAYAVRVDRVGGITIKNSLVFGCYNGIRVQTALAGGQTVTVNNCVIAQCGTGLVATVNGELVENYNTMFGNLSNYTNVTAGGNTIGYPPLLAVPMLKAGFRFPFTMGELSKWSQIARIAGTGESTDDFFGIARPTTSSKKSWAGVQVTGAIRETTTKQAGAASIKLPDAGEQFLMRVPITNVSTTISIYCYREADYAGTNPQMIIKQPGVSDRVTTDAGSASAWNQLTDTFTPATTPPYVDIFIKSSNTATSGSYASYFDTVSVS